MLRCKTPGCANLGYYSGFCFYHIPTKAKGEEGKGEPLPAGLLDAVNYYVHGYGNQETPEERARFYARVHVMLSDALKAGRGSEPLPAGLVWSREKPTQGDAHYHLREHGKNGRTIVFLSGDGNEVVTFYNGRREYLGNIHPKSEWAGPITGPGEAPKAAEAAPPKAGPEINTEADFKEWFDKNASFYFDQEEIPEWARAIAYGGYMACYRTFCRRRAPQGVEARPMVPEPSPSGQRVLTCACGGWRSLHNMECPKCKGVTRFPVKGWAAPLSGEGDKP